MAQRFAIDFHPAVCSEWAFGPGQGAVAHHIGRSHGRYDVDEVVALLGGAGGGFVSGHPFVDVDRRHHVFVLDLHAAVLEEHAHLLRHDRHTKQRLVVRHVDQLGFAALSAAAQVVVADEGVLERCARTLHLTRRAAKQAHTALVGEAAQGLPSRGGGIRAVVDAAQAVLTDAGGVHAFDGAVVQLQAGGHDQEIVGHGLSAAGDDFFALGIDLGDTFVDQRAALGHVLAGGGDHIVFGLDARGHQGETRLVVMGFAAIDDGDGRAAQSFGQMGGGGQASRTAAGNDDAGFGVHRRGLCRRAGTGQEAGASEAADGAQKGSASAGGVFCGVFDLGHVGSCAYP